MSGGQLKASESNEESKCKSWERFAMRKVSGIRVRIETGNVDEMLKEALS